MASTNPRQRPARGRSRPGLHPRRGASPNGHIKPTRLPKRVLDAVDRLASTHIDHIPPAVRWVRLFVLDSHEMFGGMIDCALRDLLVSFSSNTAPKGPMPFAAHVDEQLSRTSFSAKVELLSLSLAAFREVDVEALVGINRLRNFFAHRGFDFERAKYRGQPLWHSATLRKLDHDVFELGLMLECYVECIERAALEARARGITARGYFDSDD